jgi:hypothetical protein
MTKAKEALDLLISLEGKTHSNLQEALNAWVALFSQNRFVFECKKALKLLDKVEQGGVDTYDMCLDNCNYEEDNYDAGWNHAIAEINEKYILIERE